MAILIPILFSATVAETTAILVAAATPYENKGDKAFAVAKLIKDAFNTSTAVAENEKNYKNPKATVITAET